MVGHRTFRQMDTGFYLKEVTMTGKGLVTTIPEQRARAAKLMGWYEGVSGLGEPRYFKKGCSGFQLYVHKWAPDVYLQQAEELKARLRELGATGVCCGYFTKGVISKGIKVPAEEKHIYYAEIDLWSDEEDQTMTYYAESKLSEGEALLDAVAKIPQEGD